MNTKTKREKFQHRHTRVRKKISGTSIRQRLCVNRSLKNFSAQIIDDSTGTVEFGMSTQNKELKGQIKNGGNIAAASALGEAFAKEAIDKGFKTVCFDRSGYLYHGRVKAFADAARKGGLEF